MDWVASKLAAFRSQATFLGTIVLLLGAPGLASETRIEMYPESGGTRENRVNAQVNQRALPLTVRRVYHSDSDGTFFMEAAFARFAADGPARMTIKTGSRDPGHATLRALGRSLPFAQTAGALSFDLPGPGQYYLQLPALARSNGTFTVLFWVDDLRQLDRRRAELAAGGAVKAATRGIHSDPDTDQTAALQALLDQGGTLVLPAGVYRTGTLRLRSNTTLFLSPGAVLRAADAEEAVGAEFIAIDNARNVRLLGPGTVDANSLTRRRGHNVHNVNITSSRKVTFEDVLFEESNSWAVHIRKSDRFTARNVKIFSGKDGFDPDACRDVLIDGAFVVSADDAIAVKNRYPDDADGKTTERVTFRNSIVSTIKSALKVGTETRGPIRDVTFENCDVFDSDRGIVLYGRDGGPIERVTWRNLRLALINWPKEKESGAVFHFIVDRREGATPVRDCLVENIEANCRYRSEFAGMAEAPLQGVSFRNLKLNVEAPKTGKPALFMCRNNVNLKVDGMTIDWQGNRAAWTGVTDGKGLAVSGLREMPGKKAGAALHTTPANLPTPARLGEAFNREWTFRYFPAADADRAGCEAPGFDDSAWPAVALPHTWQTYETTGELHPFVRNASEKLSTQWWYGWGWYRKHFSIDRSQAGRKVFVEFDGVQKYCKAWLNGHFLGDHKGGFHSFYFDLTDQVRFGQDNVLAVAVNNRQADPFRIPVMDAGNWDIYGGIYRHARLLITDRLYIPFQGSAEHEGGTFITTPEVSTNKALIRVRTWVKNDFAEPKTCELVTTIVDANGAPALTTRSRKTIPPGQLTEFDETSPLSDPQLWSPESPRLYSAWSEVRENDRVADRFESSFGIRSIRWQFAERVPDNILFVNDKPVNLQGFISHQEYPWVGDAQPRWMREMDLRDIKENLGCNFFRSGHYTTDRAVYDYCDRNGLMVVEDVPNVKDKDFSREVQEQQVREMIRRDRNRPSIFAWCMGDESNRAADSKWAHEEDPTRYIHARDCAPPATGDFISLPAQNLRLGRLMSCTIRGWYNRDVKDLEPENHQSTSHEERQHQAALGKAAGVDGPTGSDGRIDQRNLIVWLYEDHGCARTYQNEPVLNINPKGWVDAYRFPKYAYYLWQANHLAEPMLFIHPHFWRAAYLGQKQDFIIDSNCDAVELKINGATFGALKPGPDNFHVVTFKDVPVQPGVLSAEGHKNGRRVSARLVLAGEPARLVLSALPDRLEAALDSLAIIKADIVDAQGAHVYGATNTVHWSVEGPATLVGPDVYQTDISKNMELDGTMYIDMPVANVIRSTGRPGSIKVRVQAAGLAMGEIPLVAEEPAPASPGPISQPALSGARQGRSQASPAPQTRHPAPQELREVSEGLDFTGADAAACARQLTERLAKANPGLDATTGEFLTLAQTLAQQLVLSRGRISAQDFAFNAAHYNQCRQLARFVDSTPLPGRFRQDLKAFYRLQMIALGNEKSYADEAAWIGTIPANTTLAMADTEDVSRLLAQVRPGFGALGEDEREAALLRLCGINPLISRNQVMTGDRKQNNVRRVVTYTAPAGAALLVPEMDWLRGDPPAKLKASKKE